MIGLTALAIVAIWCFLGFQLARRVPKWLSIENPVLSRSLSVVMLTVLMIGPFVDHILGMRQFQKLCNEQTGLQILPSATSTKHAKELSSETKTLDGNVIAIKHAKQKIVDLDTGQEIASYNYFSTRGGWVSGLFMMGGEYACAAVQKGHADREKYTQLANRTNLTYGASK